MSEAIKKDLVNIMNALAGKWADEAKDRESYKELFKAFEGNDFRSLLRDLEFKMEGLVLEAMQVIEDKIGTPPNRTVFDVLLALPFLSNKLERSISEANGSACCVDKAFHTLAKVLERETKKETA